MNLETQKQRWQSHHEDLGEIKLDRVWSHPNLRALRRQLTVETVCWTLMVAFYYTALDGFLRPLGWNIALVVALVLLIVHGFLGYRLAGRPVGDAPLRQALTKQIADLKRYSVLSLTLRTLALLIFFGFVLSTVEGLGKTPWLWRIGTIVIWTGVAFFVQRMIWRGHFRKLEGALAELEG